MKWGVVTFPGSNCDHDAYHVLKQVLNCETEFLWHKDVIPAKAGIYSIDAILLPGGFSYGDYLRTGAIAKFSPIMKSVIEFANHGGLVLGICNGFQILLESGLLPGGMLRNTSLKFICETVELKVSKTNTPFSKKYKKDEVIRMPIAHSEGNYFIDEDGLKSLQENDQVVFRYVQNPNGSLDDIAGISNKKGNVLGLMPHPERISESILGGEDGRRLFESAIEYLSH